MIQAVIFDMDGLMIETEHLQSLSFEKVLSEYGVKPHSNTDGVVQKVGKTAKENFIWLKQKHNITEEVPTLLSKKQSVYLPLLEQNITAKEGLLQLLALLKHAKIALAVASSSPLTHIKLVLSGLGIRDDFTVIVSGELVARGKPFPDIFLKAAGDLHIKPENCLVLEDSQSGVEGAHMAHMKVIAVPTRYTKSHDFTKADLILPSLSDVSLPLLHKLFTQAKS